MKKIVVFYSLEGNTKFAAEMIAEKISAELLELKPVKAYPDSGAKKFFWGGKSATFKEKPELEPYDFEPKEYDTVILGSPLWAWKIAPPLRTFLLENDLSNKNVAAFMSCGGGSTQKAFEDIRTLVKKDVLTAELTLVNPLENKDSLEQNLMEFCQKMNG